MTNRSRGFAVRWGKVGAAAMLFIAVAGTARAQDCTLTQGYWKTHPEAWPAEELTLGGVAVPASDALDLLWTAPRGDASLILVHQQIAALLNLAAGASVPAEVSDALADGDTYLADHPAGSRPGEPDRSGMIEVSGVLDDYNNGLIGPGHCGSGVGPVPTFTPTPSVPPATATATAGGPGAATATPTSPAAPTATPTSPGDPTATPTSPGDPMPTTTPAIDPTATPADPVPTASVEATATAVSPTATPTSVIDGGSSSGVIPEDEMDPSGLCPPTPAADCRVPVKSQKSFLYLRNISPDAGDKLVWKWVPGQATSISDFGNPQAGTGYTLCVYDERGASTALVLSLTAPSASPNWKRTPKGWLYKDLSMANDGVKTISLNRGGDGQAHIVFHARGANLHLSRMPLSRSPVLSAPLTQQERVTVQLWNPRGLCWASSFTTPAKRNVAGLFRDRAD